MEKREHDIFLDMASNPGASFDNLVVAGLTSNNTALQDKDAYARDEWVRDQFKNQYGEFDQIKFDKFYDNAKIFYNSLSNTNYNEAIKRQATYHRDNIFATTEQRRNGPDYIEFERANPYHITSSATELGRVGQRTLSIDELAQANKVLLNPTTAGKNLENAKWGSTPNDDFFGYFTDALVLAQYDEDGTHVDPFTGETVEHSKGELKLDDTGNFYYEKLDGRDIYGRRVLNKMNVLTTDGSFWNQYDFFDSDDLNQKSIGSSVMKNLALVGTMFLPYVGPWITGASLATQLAGLTGTLGKMLAGSDSPKLSALEGWAQSMSRQGATSEYAQEHTWCWENFINLIGDVAGLLREQRFIFEKIPYAVKGANMMTKEGQAVKFAEFEKKLLSLVNQKLGELRTSGITQAELDEITYALNAKATLQALSELQSFIKGYNKIGEILSKGYMTGITVKDTYGEAKEAGASDIDATLLTLGYAAGEYAILNTGIGEWILPELRAEKQYMRNVIRTAINGEDVLNTLKNALHTAREQFTKAATKESKKEYVKNLFNIGKNLARDVYTAEKATGEKTLKATLAAALGEGTEEVSEELLADFSKGCYDVVKWLLNDDTRLNTFGYDFDKKQWNANEILDRYGMSLVGGFVGGGLSNLGTNYQHFRDMKGLTYKQAVEELVYMGRNGLLPELMREANKMTLADKNLSINFDVKDGVPVFTPTSDYSQSQDAVAKQVLQNQINIIQGILDANGAVSDNRFLDAQTLGDLRFLALHKSTTAGLYLQTYNSLLSDIVQLHGNIENLINSVQDSNEDGVVSDREKRRNKLDLTQQSALNNLEKQLEDKKQLLKDLVEGKSAVDFISTALFETTSALSGHFTTPTFPLYAEQFYKKKYSELTEEEKAKALASYKNWKATEGRDRIYKMALIYKQAAQSLSGVLTKHADTYTSIPQELLDLNNAISQFYTIVSKDGVLRVLPLESNEEEYLELAQMATDSSPVGMNKLQSLIYRLRTGNPDETLSNISNRLVLLLGTEEDALEIKNIIGQVQNIDQNLSEEEQSAQAQEIITQYANKLDDLLLNNTLKLIQPILDRGFANAETKNQLSKLLTVALSRAANKSVEWYDWADINLPFGDNTPNPYTEISDNFKLAIELIDNLSATPLELNLNEVSIALDADPVNLTLLIEKLNNSFNNSSDNVTNFQLDETLSKELNNAIFVLELYQAAIQGARTDNANVNNLFGYNATLNEVSGKVKGSEKLNLAEIEAPVADIFEQDIRTNLNKLKFLKKLYETNQGLKLSRNDRVSINKDLLIYKKLRNIVNIQDNDPLKSWEGFLDFANAIESIKLHKDLLDTTNRNLTDNQREEFEREKLSVETAIYEFFQKNQDKLSDVNLLTQLINPLKLLLYTESKELLTEGLENLDDNSVLWWLASRAALNANDFYNQYRQIIDLNSNKPLAPISTQELAVYNNYASIVNGNIFTQFYKAARQSMLEDWKNKSIADREQILKSINKNISLANDKLIPYALNFLPIPRYLNIVLTEGIPGSGKTNSVFKQTALLLKKLHPELLNNVLVVHGANPDSATKLKDDLELDKAKSLGREQFMKEISSDWKEYEYDPVTGTYKIPSNSWKLTTENEIRSKLGVKDTSSPPKLIIIDEISKFSNYDLDLIDKFAQKYGITVLAAGDFDQSGIVGQHKISLGQGLSNLLWLAELTRTNFIRSPKLGISMRTDNAIKTGNLVKLLTYLSTPTGENIDLSYYEDETGFYGDKVLSYSVTLDNDGKEVSSDKNAVISETRAEVLKLVDTLKEGEKIGYVYNSKTSPIYDLLNKEFKKFIDFKEGGSAQGLEGQYYIIESDYHPSNSGELHNESDLKALYTGISRAQQGSIIIAPFSDNKSVIPLNSTQITLKVNEPLTATSIIRYATKKKEILDKIVSDGNVPTIVPRTKEIDNAPEKPINTNPTEGLDDGIDSTPSPTTTEPVVTPVIPEVTPTTPESSTTTPEVIEETSTEEPTNMEESTNPVEPTEKLAIEESVTDQTTSSIDEEMIPTVVYEEDPVPVVSTDVISEEEYKNKLDEASETKNLGESTVTSTDSAIEMLLHSFNTFELGVNVDENGYPVPVGNQEWMDSRIDSVNGLVKIDKLLGNPIRTVAEYEKILGTVRSIIFNTTDKSKLEERLKLALGLNKIYCTFALKSTPIKSENTEKTLGEFVGKKPNPYDKGISEKTKYNGSYDVNSLNVHSKSFIAIIGSDSNLLEIPLFALSSPFTLTQIKDENGQRVYEQIYNRMTQLRDLGYTPMLIANTLISEFGNVAKYRPLINLFKLFRITDGAVWYKKDPQWTVAKDLQLIGNQFITNAGYYQLEPGLLYNRDGKSEQEWITVSELATNPNFVMTDRVMVARESYVDDVENKVFNAGHGFVLISGNKSLNSNKKLLDQYIKQQRDPSAREEVKLVYVLPPKASFNEYFENLVKIVSKDNTRKNIGQLFTSYRLLKHLMQDNQFRQILDSRLSGAVEKIDLALKSMEGLSRGDIKNMLYEVHDWTDVGGLGKQKLVGLFDMVLLNVSHVRQSLTGSITYTPDVTSIAMIENILKSSGIDGVYYRINIPVEAEHLGTVLYAEQSGYAIDGKDFRIHGKIDSYTFKGSMDSFIEEVLNNTRPQKSEYSVEDVLLGRVPNGHVWSVDNLTYGINTQSAIVPGNSKLGITTGSIQINNLINQVKTKLGIDISTLIQGKSISEANKLVVDKINSEDNNSVAFTIGDKLFISNADESLKGQIYLYDSSNNPITDIRSLADNNGKYAFTLSHEVNGQRVESNVEYNSKTNEMDLIDPVQQKESTITLSVTELNFEEYKESGSKILEDLFLLDPSLEDAFKTTSVLEYLQALLDKIPIGEMLIEELESLLPMADDIQKQILNDLITNERAIDPDLETQEGEICPITIKIKF